MKVRYRKHTLDFIKPAKTSKIDYSQKDIIIVSVELGGTTYEGECAPLPHLSIETIDDCEKILKDLSFLPSSVKKAMEIIETFPSSLKLAFEGCFLQHQLNSKAIHAKPIKINGLIWMNGFDMMEKEVIQKVKAGFDCIKVKIGQHDFDAECRFLEKVRKQYADNIELRLDANGAFEIDEALEKLNELKRFNIHSIEQPIPANHWDAMEMLCQDSPIAIGLDEELIDVKMENKEKLIKKINPPYLILKPSLHGGFQSCDHWVSLAQKHDVQWWATSALESNIGLYHIALWLSKYHIKLPQGLGTGSLFKENFERPFHYEKNLFCWDN